MAKKAVKAKTNNRLPKFTQKYFWDIDATKLDTEKHATYVIERLLELGNPQSACWLLEHYSRRKIIGVLKKTRSLSRMSANFWAVYFSVPRSEILCLSKRYQKQLSGAWQY